MDQVSSATPSSSPILVVDGSEMAQSPRRELCHEAQRRGWKLVELGTDDGYPEIDIAAARHRADIVAFAGPESSQCKAAVVASGRELPYAYLPAGRRDLFARELGIDTDDGVRALNAIEDSCEYYVDLAEVNGVTFVNYAALGLDCRPARPVPSAFPSAWAFTSLAVYNVARRQPPPRLHWFPGSGRERCTALFVSNNRRRFESHAVGGRARLDGGVLGIGVLDAKHDAANALDYGQSWRELLLRYFEVDSGGPVRADVDGEVMLLEPPVRFRILPRALRVRIPLRS
jgi:diacylglycerol kinase family enzyme